MKCMWYGVVSSLDCSWLTGCFPYSSSHTLCRQGDEPLVCIYVDSCTIGSLGTYVRMYVCTVYVLCIVVGTVINDLPVLVGSSTACTTAWGVNMCVTCVCDVWPVLCCTAVWRGEVCLVLHGKGGGRMKCVPFLC